MQAAAQAGGAGRGAGAGAGAGGCHKCGKTGHWSRDCTAPREEWTPYLERAPGAAGAPRPPGAAAAGEPTAENDPAK
jgi:hypothetical protein